MKIALISGSRIPSRTANSIQTLKMADAFGQIGKEVHVFVPGNEPGIPWEQLAAHYGLQSKFPIRWLKTIPWLRAYDFGWRAVRAARLWGANLIYTRHPQAAAIAGRLGYPTIFEAHDMPAGKMGPRLMRAFLRSRASRRLVVITRALQAALKQGYHLPHKEEFSIVAPDGVDLERYQDLPAPRAARRQLGLPERFSVGYSGHLYPGRGIELILQLAASLPNVNFLLMGGEQGSVQEVGEQASKLKLDNVNLLGFIPNQQLPLYQAACEALLMPYQSHVAGSSGGDIARYLSPMKMFEYLASGRAVLASDLPVLAEVLEHGVNALVIPAGDLSAWESAVKKVQADPDFRVRLGENGRQTAARHTWQQRARTIIADLEND